MSENPDSSNKNIASQSDLLQNKDNNISYQTSKKIFEIANPVNEIIGKISKNKIHYIDSRSNSKQKSLRDTYTRCYQTNFKLTSNHKSFNLPFRINRNSFSIGFVPSSLDKKSRRNKRMIISASSLFIGGGQRLKGMNLYLGGKISEKEIRADNIGIRTTIQTSSSKKSSPDKRMNNISNVNNVEIDLSKNYELLDLNSVLKYMNGRWKKLQQITSNRLGFIKICNEIKNDNNDKEKIIFDKEKYIIDITKTVKIEKNKKNNYVLIMKDNNNSTNIMTQNISVNNQKELESAVNKFMSKNKNLIENNKENNGSNNLQNNNNSYYSLLIFTEEQLKNLLKSFPSGDIQKDNITNNTKSIKKGLINEISMSIDGTPSPNKQKKINDSIINSNTNINIHEKNCVKNMEDFGQSTPISLLQEKYSIYAVSKWAKYSIPNPQSRIYYFNNNFIYKNRPKFFDPLFLDMTNFTLWIERIQLQKKSTKNSLNVSGSFNHMRNKSNSKLLTRKKSNTKYGNK